MSKLLLSEFDIRKLKNNKFVLSVSSKFINYTTEFKVHFIEEYESGKLPKQIFEEAGFNVQILGDKRIHNMSYKWRLAYKKDGIIGLQDSRKQFSGRPILRTLTYEQLVGRKDAEIKYLKAEIEMLKKLDKEERPVMKINKNLKPCFVFQLIKSVADKNPFKNIISYLCKSDGVSTSGYYNYISSEYIRNKREKIDLKSRDLILKIFNRRGYKKGSRSIKMILEREFNVIYSLKKIKRIMKKYGIECPHRRSNPYRKMAKATKEHRVVENKLKRKFKQDIPGKVLLTDITYMPYGKGKMAYLSTINKLNKNKRVNLVKDTYIQTRAHIILVLSFKVY